METRRLALLAELARLGSMRAVADALDTTTSTVSQQIAALSRETGSVLVEPDGRRVRLTPAGRRLAEHAVTILAAVEEARLDLGPEAEPNGTIRIAGFATAIRGFLLPVIRDLAVSHPRVRVLVREHEPAEALALLAGDQADLALTYDYNLAPAADDPSLSATPLWTAPWGLGVPALPSAPSGTTQDPDGTAQDRSGATRGPDGTTGGPDGTTGGPDGTTGGPDGTTLETFARFSAYDWIVNSRNTADEHVIRTLASMAGFSPRITHQADSLDLVQDMIAAGLGVGLLPIGHATYPAVRILPLASPGVELRSCIVARHGRLNWPPLALVTGLLADRAAAMGPGHDSPGPRRP